MCMVEGIEKQNTTLGRNQLVTILSGKSRKFISYMMYIPISRNHGTAASVMLVSLEKWTTRWLRWNAARKSETCKFFSRNGYSFQYQASWTNAVSQRNCWKR